MLCFYKFHGEITCCCCFEKMSRIVLFGFFYSFYYELINYLRSIIQIFLVFQIIIQSNSKRKLCSMDNTHVCKFVLRIVAGNAFVFVYALHYLATAIHYFLHILTSSCCCNFFFFEPCVV